MYEDLRQRAERKVAAKSGVAIFGIIFASTSVILILLSLYLTGIAVWLLLPIPAMAMVFGILYVQTFGFSSPSQRSTDWREAAIQEEMDFLQATAPDADSLEDLSDDEWLELKELKRLKEKWER